MFAQKNRPFFLSFFLSLSLSFFLFFPSGQESVDRQIDLPVFPGGNVVVRVWFFFYYFFEIMKRIEEIPFQAKLEIGEIYLFTRKK